MRSKENPSKIVKKEIEVLQVDGIVEGFKDKSIYDYFLRGEGATIISFT